MAFRIATASVTTCFAKVEGDSSSDPDSESDLEILELTGCDGRVLTGVDFGDGAGDVCWPFSSKLRKGVGGVKFPVSTVELFDDVGGVR